MMLSELIAKLEVVQETSGDMEVFWRDSPTLTPVGGLAMLTEDLIINDERTKGPSILVIRSAHAVQQDAAIERTKAA